MRRSKSGMKATLLMIGMLAPAVVVAASDPVGWICQSRARRWLQFSPCPTTSMRASAVNVDGVIAGTGQMVHGTGTVDVPTAVQSTPLDSDGVCAALGDPSLSIPHHGSSDTYERSVLRSRYCG